MAALSVRHVVQSAYLSLCEPDRRWNGFPCCLVGTARRNRLDFRISAEATASSVCASPVLSFPAQRDQRPHKLKQTVDLVNFADYSMHVIEDEHATAACQLQGRVL